MTIAIKPDTNSTVGNSSLSIINLLTLAPPSDYLFLSLFLPLIYITYEVRHFLPILTFKRKKICRLLKAYIHQEFMAFFIAHTRQWVPHFCFWIIVRVNITKFINCSRHGINNGIYTVNFACISFLINL